MLQAKQICQTKICCRLKKCTILPFSNKKYASCSLRVFVYGCVCVVCAYVEVRARAFVCVLVCACVRIYKFNVQRCNKL